MKKRKIRLAIIGATGTAYKRIIPALKDSDICQICAIQARDSSKLEMIRAEYLIEETYTDITELLSKAEFDCIYIATPPFLHIDHIKKAASTRKPIICEKPLGIDFSNCNEILRYLKEYTSREFMIAHHLRHQKTIQDIKDFLDSGTIGKVLGVYMQWGFEMAFDSRNSIWKKDPTLGGLGAFNDVGVHLLDLALYWFGPPKSVSGKINKIRTDSIYDNETAFLFYDNFCAQLQASQSMKYAGNHLLIYGSNGSIEIPNFFGEKSANQLFLRVDDKTSIIEYPDINLYKNEIENFCEGIINPCYNIGGTTLNNALDNMKIIDIIRNSARRKAIIEI